MIGNQSAFVWARTRYPWRTSVFLGLALAILHGFLAIIYIDHPRLDDEMYHMLAADSWRTSAVQGRLVVPVSLPG
jgi:hypothetical protein